MFRVQPTRPFTLVLFSIHFFGNPKTETIEAKSIFMKTHDSVKRCSFCA